MTPIERCDACYGTGNGSAICRRPKGHPSIADDGVGHAPHMTRHDRLLRTGHSGANPDSSSRVLGAK